MDNYTAQKQNNEYSSGLYQMPVQQRWNDNYMQLMTRQQIEKYLLGKNCDDKKDEEYEMKYD